MGDPSSFGAALMSGRLGKRGARTGFYYDRYFVLDEQSLQYESTAGSRTMKALGLEALEDVKLVQSKLCNELIIVFSGAGQIPEQRLEVRARSEEHARAWARAVLDARDRLRARQTLAGPADASTGTEASVGVSAATGTACGDGGVREISVEPAIAKGAGVGAGTQAEAGVGPPPPPPPPPPGKPRGPPKATARPQALTAAEIMKRHLRRKANVQIVASKGDILALVAEVLAGEWPSADEAEAAADTVAKRADAFEVPVEGENWGTRLAIPSKDGGGHFSQEELARAAAAHDRASALLDYAARLRQLRSRARGAATLGSALEANADLTREKRLEKLHDALLGAVRLYREVFTGKAAEVESQRFEEAGLPVGALKEAAEALIGAVPTVADAARDVARQEIASLERETASGKRLRAGRAQTTAEQALAVHADAVAQLEHLGRPVPEHLVAWGAELRAEAERLGALAESAVKAGELDDTV